MSKKTYQYRIGEAADDLGWFGAFYGSNRRAIVNETQDELAQKLGIDSSQIYNGNEVCCNLSPEGLSYTPR